MSAKLAALTAAVVALAAPAADAADPIQTVFSFTGAEQSYTVPDGVTAVRVTAVGASGGAGGIGPHQPHIVGGGGATVTGDLTVTPGEVLYVEVGGQGGTGDDSGTGGQGGWGGGGPGGYGYLGPGAFGGGGGGASDVRLCSMSTVACAPAQTSIASRLLVAGGGGGGGGAQLNGLRGGQGGDAGKLGSPGEDQGGFGGGGATQSAAGAGGHGHDCPVATGSGNRGDDGGAGGGGIGGSGLADFDTGWGGGGGGGYYGGGGGGDAGDQSCSTGGGGGGGGGSSYGPAGATFATAQWGDPPSVTIRPLHAQAQVTPHALTFGAQSPSSVSLPQTVTITNAGEEPLAVSALSFTGPARDDFFIGSSTCGGAVTPGASCRLTVRFAPAAAGSRAATVTIATNDPAGPATVSLTGTGATTGTPTVSPQGGGTPVPPAPNAQKAARTVNGQVKLIACRAIRVRARHGRRTITRCTTRRLSPNASFVVGATPTRATLTHRRTVVATGLSRGRVLTLRASRPLSRGAYTLTLVYPDHRTTLTVTVG